MNVGDRVLTDKGSGQIVGFWVERKDSPRRPRSVAVIVALDAGYHRLFRPQEIQVLEEVT